MNQIKQVCQQFEAMSYQQKSQYLLDSATKILPVLHAVLQSRSDTAHLYTSFVTAAIAADGKLDDAEYTTAQSLLLVVLGEGYDRDALQKMMQEERKQLAATQALVAAIVAQMPAELKREFVYSALCICAADGKISNKELDWIASLI